MSSHKCVFHLTSMCSRFAFLVEPTTTAVVMLIEMMIVHFINVTLIVYNLTTFLKPVREHPCYCGYLFVFQWITGKRVFVYPPFPRRSWRTSRRLRACLRRRRSPSCLDSWPWWTYWCLPALSTSARLKQRRTCRQEGWWGNASVWVSSNLYLYSFNDCSFDCLIRLWNLFPINDKAQALNLTYLPFKIESYKLSYLGVSVTRKYKELFRENMLVLLNQKCY